QFSHLGCMASDGKTYITAIFKCVVYGKKRKAIPISVLKDAAITIQGAKFTRDFK
ncbi:hypothetical protein KI387_016686, partial [Taxus chinensis]